jgi:outer membrane protein OmpU
MMKKILLSTTLLAASAVAAAAEVTISGSGRFGLVYEENRTEADPADPTLSIPANETLVSGRLRFNVDASTETDSGATFGGRIRFQDVIEDSNGAARFSPAYLYVSYEGLRVEVGNANTAFDSAALYYDSEIGYISSSFGNKSFDFYSFSSGPYGADEVRRVGVYAAYSVGDFTGQISYIDGDQVSDLAGPEEEFSIALAYETDQFTVSAAAVQDGAGILDNDQYFLGGAYNVSEAIRVGLLYTSTDDGLLAHQVGDTVTLFGSYTTGPTKIEAYIANNDDEANISDTVYGIGADYDLGGATLSGSIQRGYDEDIYADLGVNFSF